MAAPDFIIEMRRVRKEIVSFNEFGKLVGQTPPPQCKQYMRAMNIIGAFAAGRDIRSVESGDLDNRPFTLALQLAIEFIRNYGESQVNRDFDDWVVENLTANSNYITIYNAKENSIFM